MSDAVVDAARARGRERRHGCALSALFRLRSLGTEDAVQTLVERLDREREASALMRHEVAFALGQMGATGAIGAVRDAGGFEREWHGSTRVRRGVGGVGIGARAVRRGVANGVCG